MELKSYCDSLLTEVSGWKAKVYDVVRKLDKMPSGDKEKVLPEVQDLHILIEELDDRISRLRKECPDKWHPDKIELEGKFSGLREAVGNVWENISPGDLGG